MTPHKNPKKPLDSAWTKFITLTRRRLKGERPSKTQKGNLYVIGNRNLEIRNTVKELEESNEFHALLTEFSKIAIHEVSRNCHLSFWKHGIGNYLKRSGIYLQIASGESLDLKIEMKKLLGALEKKTKTIIYLAPMEFIHLAKEFIDCSNFKIQRFSILELEGLLDQNLNEIFYPHAFFNPGFLSSYWFVVVNETKPIFPVGKINFHLGEIGKVKLKYSEYPSLERAFRRLAFYDWRPDFSRGDEIQLGDWKGWMAFRIPFVISISDNFLEAPLRAPEISKLSTEPYFDSYTNEELGEGPEILIRLDDEETERLKETIEKLDELLRTFEAAEFKWPFVSVSLGFLTKAFFVNGLEQLLWHIASIEALVGERGNGVTNRLADRVGNILGGTKEECKKFKKQFKEVYDFRSGLVHGREFTDEIWESHLYHARDMARRILFWFLNFLKISHAALESTNPQGYLNRQEILAAIDFGTDTIHSLSNILGSLPPKFPNNSSWIEP